MSEDKYLSSNKSTLFSIEDEIDDDEFLRRPTSTRNCSFNTTSNSFNVVSPVRDENTFEERRLQLLQQKKEIEERSVESTKKSLGFIRDSEDVAIATAEELMKQREQLERTDKRLDDINATLRFSHKHIQGIKSVFGSLKNYLSGKSDTPSEPRRVYTSSDSEAQTKSHLSRALASSSTTSSSGNEFHPGLSIRGIGSPSTNTNPQQIIDQNIDEMVTSISRLKDLAHGLGEEIEIQNDLLDNMLPKVEKSDITLRRQKKDIQGLLK